ncbi:hypothetical protein DH2020_021660 [Rehmannia glutinosa]|uniref:Tyrosine-specific transport protein n=1 Tax=Rehmannia glutinosa TaxID=99300 RepID=A0ABR0WFD5_REHGL
MEHFSSRNDPNLGVQFGCGFSYSQLGWQKSQSWKFSEANKKKFVTVNLKDDESVKISRKKGSIGGAVALIIGTSIGSGILALPKKTSPARNPIWSQRRLHFCDSLLFQVGRDPTSFNRISRVDFWSFLRFLFTVLISIGGTRATDQVNQWLTVSMIGLLIAIEVLAVVFGGWSGFEGSGGDWGKVPATLPVMIFALVYHDLAPVLCAYLDGDLSRIRASVFLGSVVPLLALLIWEAIALGLSNQADQVSDPVELLLKLVTLPYCVRWGGVPFMVETFSLLAVGTSLIGTLLSFSEFFKEQLNNLSLDIPSAQLLKKSNSSYYISNWWEKNKANVTATAMVVAPSLLVSTTVPDAFSAATDIAGGYCMTMLYGVLPPAMAWAMMKKKKKGQENDQSAAISKAGAALVGVGLFACGIVVEQILQDFSFLHP